VELEEVPRELQAFLWEVALEVELEEVKEVESEEVPRELQAFL